LWRRLWPCLLPPSAAPAPYRRARRPSRGRRALPSAPVAAGRSARRSGLRAGAAAAANQPAWLVRRSERSGPRTLPRAAARLPQPGPSRSGPPMRRACTRRGTRAGAAKSRIPSRLRCPSSSACACERGLSSRRFPGAFARTCVQSTWFPALHPPDTRTLHRKSVGNSRAKLAAVRARPRRRANWRRRPSAIAARRRRRAR
jgi:hypothetical protein